MPEANKEEQVIVGDSSMFLGRLIAPGAMFLVVLSIWTAIRMIWKEVDDRRIWILASSITSILIFFIVPQILKARVIPAFIKGVAALLLFAPFGLGCYLLIFEGLGQLRLLEGDFSFGLVIAAIIYVVGGFGVVKATYNISEFAQSTRDGTIRFE